MAYATPTSASLPDRMMRAAKLDVPFYEEVEADTTATNQALLVVVLVSVASGIGSAIAAAIAGGPSANPIGGLIGGVISALIGWFVWSFVIYFVGTRMFGGTATYGELLRTLGFAESPGVLAILSFIPVLGGIVAFAAGIWVIVASFIATRQALDISNGKTVGTIIVAIIAVLCVLTVIAILLGTVFGLGMLLGGAAATRP